MKRHRPFMAPMLLGFGLAGHLAAESVGEFEDVQWGKNTAESGFDLSWTGKPDRYYFVEQSPDLSANSWSLFPYAVIGDGGEAGLFLDPEPERFFFRLRYTDDTADPLLNDDFDADGVSNRMELLYGLNPFDGSDTPSTDSDGNGLPDWWELQHFGATAVDPDADPDGDGFTNREEFRAALDPHDPLNSTTSQVGVAPAAPQNLRVTDGTDLTSARLSWEDHSESEVLFRIERRIHGQGFETVGTVPANTTQWTDAGLDPGEIHIYRVFAVGN